MARRKKIYEGKAKILYEGPEPGTLVQYFKDEGAAGPTATEGENLASEGKGVLNNRLSEFFMSGLNSIGVPTHFIRRINMREQLVREVEIVPLEVVVRNFAAGDLSARLGIPEGTAEVNKLSGAISDMADKTRTATSIMQSSWAKMSAAVAGGNLASMAIEKVIEKLNQLKERIEEAAKYAARVETLGVAMKAVGNNAGYTGNQMSQFEAGVKKLGITTEASRDALTRMAGANMDLTKATGLARVAQDAAVIGNINSSEAFQRMIQGIRSGETEILRNLGIQVNFEAAYRKTAQALGKTTADLNEHEKVVARTNAALEYGVMIQGAYEASMTTTGKKLTSMTRLYDELKLAMGEAFAPALGVLIDATTDRLKALLNWFTENKGALAEFAKNLADIVAMAAHPLKGLGSFISAPWSKNYYDEAGMSSSAADDAYDKEETRRRKQVMETNRIMEADAHKKEKELDDKRAADKFKAEKEMEKYLQHATDTPGFMNWKREQEMLKVESEYIKKLAKEQAEALKETSHDTAEEWSKGFKSVTGDMEEFFKKYYGAQQSALEDQLAAVNSLEAAYKLSPDDASLQRIAIYQKSIDLLKEQGDTGVESLNKIRTENEKLLAQQKAMYDRTLIGGMTNAMQEYGKAAEDVGAQVKNAFSGAFQTLEDSFTKFLLTGKLSMKSFFDSIKQSLAKMAAQRIVLAVTGVVSTVGGAVTNAVAGNATNSLMNYGSTASTGYSAYGAAGGASSYLVGTSGTTALGSGTMSGGLMSSAATSATGGSAATAGTSGIFGSGGSIGATGAGALGWGAAFIAAAAVVGQALAGMFNGWKSDGVELTAKGGDFAGGTNVFKSKGGWIKTDRTSYHDLTDQQTKSLDQALTLMNETLINDARLFGKSEDEIQRAMSEVTTTGRFASAGIFIEQATTDMIYALFPDLKGTYTPIITTIRETAQETGDVLYETITTGGEFIESSLIRGGEDLKKAYARIMNTLRIDTGLKMQILEVQGLQQSSEYLNYVVLLRNQELVGLEDSTKALKTRLWQLQDEAASTAIAAAAAERYAEAMAASQSWMVRLFAVSGQDGLSGLYALQIQQENELAEAKKSGMDTTLLLQVQSLEMADAMKTAANTVSAATQKILDSAKKALTDSISVTQSILNTKLALLTGPAAMLSPEEAYKRSRTLFEGSDATNVSANATAFLEASKNFSPNAEAYQTDFQKTITALNRFSGVKGDPSDTQKQINLLTSIADAVSKGDKSLLTVLETQWKIAAIGDGEASTTLGAAVTALASVLNSPVTLTPTTNAAATAVENIRILSLALEGKNSTGAKVFDVPAAGSASYVAITGAISALDGALKGKVTFPEANNFVLSIQTELLRLAAVVPVMPTTTGIQTFYSQIGNKASTESITLQTKNGITDFYSAVGGVAGTTPITLPTDEQGIIKFYGTIAGKANQPITADYTTGGGIGNFYTTLENGAKVKLTADYTTGGGIGNFYTSIEGAAKLGIDTSATITKLTGDGGFGGIKTALDNGLNVGDNSVSSMLVTFNTALATSATATQTGLTNFVNALAIVSDYTSQKVTAQSTVSALHDKYLAGDLTAAEYTAQASKALLPLATTIHNAKTYGLTGLSSFTPQAINLTPHTYKDINGRSWQVNYDAEKYKLIDEMVDGGGRYYASYRNIVNGKQQWLPWGETPSFATGTASVPYDMTANIHQGEIIMDRQSSDVLRKYGIPTTGAADNREMVTELKALREEVAQLRSEQKSANIAIANNTGKTAKRLDRWDGDGMPDLRAIA